MSIKKNDFIEVVFTARSDGQVFDSNDAKVLADLKSESKAHPLKIIVGEGMVVKGLDSAFIGKDVGTHYTVTLTPEEGFGHRKRELIRTVPISMFEEQKIRPYAGMTVVIDSTLAHIRSVSGARVMIDLNNPLAGKTVEYVFTITKKIEDHRERAEIFFTRYLRAIPKFETSSGKITVKADKKLQFIIDALQKHARELLNAELVLEHTESATNESDNISSTQQSL